jgi:hypothetical protein
MRRGATRSQIGIEAGEAVVQPPAARPAHPAVLRRLVVEDIYGDDRPFARRRAQCSLIGKAQVAT